MVNQQACTLLLVEDEAIIALAKTRSLQQFGHEVIHVFTGEEAVTRVQENPGIDLILMDIDLGEGISGPEAAEQILEERELPIVFLTAHAEREMVERVRRITRYGYVLKNAGDFVLREAIEMALELFAAQRQTRRELAKNAAILNAIPDIAFVMTLDGTFVEARAPDPEMLTIPSESIAGTHLRDLFPAEDVERHLASYRYCHESGETQRIEYKLTVAGAPRIYEARISRLDDEHVLALARDVTEDRDRERLDRERERAGYAADEQLLRRKLNFQKLVATISTDFMRAAPDEMDDTIRSTLGLLGEYYGADRCYMVEFHLDQQSMSASYEWTVPGVESVIHQLQNVPVDRYSWILSQIRAGDTVQVPDVESLPPEAKPEYDRFRERQVRSMLAVPLVSAERTEGYLGFHGVRTRTKWSPEQIEQMRIPGEIIARAVARRRTVRELALERSLLNVLLDRSPDFIYFKDRESRFIRASRSMAWLHEREEPGEILGLTDEDRLTPDESLSRRRQELHVMETGVPLVDLEEQETAADGTVLWRSSTKVPLYGEGGELLGIFGISRDITDRKRTDQDKERLLEEKEVLLREVHHRVRNTLGMMRSLVSLYSERIAASADREVMNDLQSRLEGIITLFSLIDTTEDHRQVPVQDYLTTLIDTAADAFGDTEVRVERDLAPCTMDTRTVVPLGLIVNELLTNAWKHAFTGAASRDWELRVTMRRSSSDTWELVIADNGTGLSRRAENLADGGTGLVLVRALAGQMQGVFTLTPGDPGTIAILRFPAAYGECSAGFRIDTAT